MKKFLVKSRPDNGVKVIRYRTYEAETAADAICKANADNGHEWHVIAIYEELWRY